MAYYRIKYLGKRLMKRRANQKKNARLKLSEEELEEGSTMAKKIEKKRTSKKKKAQNTN